MSVSLVSLSEIYLMSKGSEATILFGGVKLICLIVFESFEGKSF
jgi:hypothetical protein